MQNRFCPKDLISEMEMEGKMGALKLGLKQDPQDSDDKICEIQAKFGCSFSEPRRAAYILKAGKKQHALILTSGLNSIQKVDKREPFSHELIDIM